MPSALGVSAAQHGASFPVHPSTAPSQLLSSSALSAGTQSYVTFPPEKWQQRCSPDQLLRLGLIRGVTLERWTGVVSGDNDG